MQAILVLYFADTLAHGGMGMSATTKLAPAAFAGQTMSLWFLSLALANGIQAQAVKLYDDVSQPAHFGANGAIAVAAGLAVIAVAP
jgi:POT family proton-dependent oligopeptide transporter